MGVSIKFRRGTAAEHTTFTGAEGEITVLKSDVSGDPWRLKVHDDDSTSFTIPTIDSVDSLTNKTLTNQKWSGTISDASSNLLASVGTSKITFASGAVTLDSANVIDQATEKTLEAMIARIARKNQMILGD
jgi:hypothetical protein